MNRQSGRNERREFRSGTSFRGLRAVIALIVSRSSATLLEVPLDRFPADQTTSRAHRAPLHARWSFKPRATLSRLMIDQLVGRAKWCGKSHRSRTAYYFFRRPGCPWFPRPCLAPLVSLIESGPDCVPERFPLLSRAG